MDFTSDNHFGVHPQIMQAIVDANVGSVDAYGADPYSAEMSERLADVFEHEVQCFLCCTGTAANSLAIAALCPSFGTIYCTAEAHINNDECNSPQIFCGGAKIMECTGEMSKLDIKAVKEDIELSKECGARRSKPSCISITQTTELGAVYTLDELKEIGDLAHANGLGLHLDGARFANALVRLGCTPAEMTWKVGVDVMAFGATKNGAMIGDVVVFFNKERAENFAYMHKAAGQTMSKARYAAAQVIAYLKDDLWLNLARHANAMAEKLAREVEKMDGCGLLLPVRANEVFVKMSAANAAYLKEKGAMFYLWSTDLYRFVTSWQTTEEMVDSLARTLNEALAN